MQRGIKLLLTVALAAHSYASFYDQQWAQQKVFSTFNGWAHNISVGSLKVKKKAKPRKKAG